MMKIFALFTLIGVTSAFVNNAPRSSAVKMASTAEPVSEMSAESEEPAFSAPKIKTPIKAKWFPFGVNAPRILDGTMAGDAGFDPLGFSGSEKTLYWMRESELKHGRLAMLGAVGWPLSELFHKGIADALGWDSILVNGDRAPSLLNGGLSNNFVTSMLVLSIAIAGTLEGKDMNKGDIFWNAEKSEGYVPGDFGFDPLSLYKFKKGDKKAMETAEIKNGRLAMLAITYFAYSEFFTKLAVVEQTPYLF